MRTYTWIMVEILLILLMGWWGIRSIKPLKVRVAKQDSVQMAFSKRLDTLAAGQQDSIVVVRKELRAMRKAVREALEQSDLALALARRREREVAGVVAYQDRIIATLFYGRSDSLLARGIRRFRERTPSDVLDSLWNQRLNNGSRGNSRPLGEPPRGQEAVPRSYNKRR